MRPPLEDLENIRKLQEETKRLLDASHVEEALETINEALTVESNNVGTLSLKADVLERLERVEEAEALLFRIKELKREAWQRQVEAEARGQHEIFGTAIRHENP